MVIGSGYEDHRKILTSGIGIITWGSIILRRLDSLGCHSRATRSRRVSEGLVTTAQQHAWYGCSASTDTAIDCSDFPTVHFFQFYPSAISRCSVFGTFVVSSPQQTRCYVFRSKRRKETIVSLLFLCPDGKPSPSPPWIFYHWTTSCSHLSPKYIDSVLWLSLLSMCLTTLELKKWMLLMLSHVINCFKYVQSTGPNSIPLLRTVSAWSTCKSVLLAENVGICEYYFLLWCACFCLCTCSCSLFPQFVNIRCIFTGFSLRRRCTILWPFHMPARQN